MTILYILLAIFIFGVLIFIHELGHYISARIFDVSIIEFAIGMGPRIFSRASKKTGITYSLRLFPIGGFVSMEGEDDYSEDERALHRKPAWQRIIISAAGSIMNLLLGVLLSFIMILSTPVIGGTTISAFNDDAISSQSGLAIGDEIISIDGAHTSISTQVVYEISRSTNGPVDMCVRRDGKKVIINDVNFGHVSEEGMVFGVCDFKIKAEPKNFATIAKHTIQTSMLSVKMVWQSIGDLVTGKYGIEAVSGPVGVTNTISDVAKESTVSLLYLCSIITVNLGIFNLLPIPALDGSHILFDFIALIIGRPINKKIEGYIHAVGIVSLLGLMLIVTFFDIIKLF